ncbi:MAG TPA: anthrone oxygenase family protein [Anaerolineales bacterium]|nr:anthrone oxygenase family protein [Anaerolineales bacterium]
MLIDTLLVLGLLSTGLFAGLMMTLVVVMQKQWNTLEKEAYIQYFKGFLLVAKGNPIVSVLTLASFLLPTAIGIAHFISGNTYQGAFALIAGIVFFLGCFGVTMRLNFPIYARVISWNDAESVTDWKEVRRRFYILNVIRMTSAVVAFLLLGTGVLT